LTRTHYLFSGGRFAGSVEKTGTAATQVSALFGAATPGSYSVWGETVAFIGSPSDWSLRRIILTMPTFAPRSGASMRG